MGYFPDGHAFNELGPADFRWLTGAAQEVWWLARMGVNVLVGRRTFGARARVAHAASLLVRHEALPGEKILLDQDLHLVKEPQDGMYPWSAVLCWQDTNGPSSVARLAVKNEGTLVGQVIDGHGDVAYQIGATERLANLVLDRLAE